VQTATSVVRPPGLFRGARAHLAMATLSCACEWTDCCDDIWTGVRGVGEWTDCCDSIWAATWQRALERALAFRLSQQFAIDTFYLCFLSHTFYIFEESWFLKTIVLLSYESVVATPDPTKAYLC
jgi:hypothetical protein